MAMHSGIGFSKIIVLVGASYTTTLLVRNGKLSDLIGELQSLGKGMGNSGEKAISDFDYSDAISAQVRRLALEVRQLASARPITILNGDSSQITNISSLVIPAAALGALGYGYMWWKGIRFSDLMYVTKHSMANAVSNLTKHLEHVSDALAATKKHLTQRIQNLDGKLDDQKELSKLIRGEVADVRIDVSQIGYDLNALQSMISGLDGKICTLEDKQDIANIGVLYLCNFVDGKKLKMPEMLQDKLKLSGRSPGLISSFEKPSLMGLKELIAGSLVSANSNNACLENNIEKFSIQPRCMMRTVSESAKV